MEYKRGDKVKCNGNPNGVVQEVNGTLIEVRLWSGLRHIGDVTVGKTDLDKENDENRQRN